MKTFLIVFEMECIVLLETNVCDLICTLHTNAIDELE